MPSPVEEIGVRARDRRIWRIHLVEVPVERAPDEPTALADRIVLLEQRSDIGQKLQGRDEISATQLLRFTCKERHEARHRVLATFLEAEVDERRRIDQLLVPR